MMRGVLRVVIVLVVLAAAWTAAAAQEHEVWPERLSIAVDVPFQPMNNGFSEVLVFPDTIRKTQAAQFTADYGSTRGALFDVGGAVRVSRRVGVGVTVSVLRRSADGAFTLTVPSLIAGNPPLSLNGSVADLERRDVGVHLQGLYAIGLGDSSRVTLSAGPSIFNTSQDLVRSIEFDTLPGLTTLRFDQAFVTHGAKTVVGFNLGADVTWNFATHIGVGTIARYSRAKVTLDPGSASGVDRSVALHGGGVHVGAGLRFRF
jgi:hypothetical protein